MLETIFFISALLIDHAYFGYPLSLYLLNKWKGKSFKYVPSDVKFNPTVSIIIAAHNEEDNIAQKLENTLNLTYMPEKVEIVVASDASLDWTDEIVRNIIKKYPERNIKLVRQEENLGKEAAQKLALGHATGEICVFTDVATTLTPPTLNTLIGNFYDERVGAVDGMSKIVTNYGEVSGEGVYLKYENKIREWEAKLGSTVSLGGCLFAARKELLHNFSPNLQSDFRTALQTVTQGYQAIIDTNAVALFSDLVNPSKESARKHRTTVRSINNLLHHLYLLNPFKYGIFSYQLFCHKLLKWLVPFFMISAYGSNILLAISPDSIWWPILFILQSIFYSHAIFGMKHEPSDNSILGTILWKIPGFLLLSNLALFKAWISYAKGERFVTWKPSKR